MKINNMINPISPKLSSVSSVKEGVGGFKEVFSKALDNVNDKQVAANKLAEDFSVGKTDDIHKVMIATQEAQLTMQLAVQINNKLVDAYKEIIRMQI